MPGCGRVGEGRGLHVLGGGWRRLWICSLSLVVSSTRSPRTPYTLALKGESHALLLTHSSSHPPHHLTVVFLLFVVEMMCGDEMECVEGMRV